MPIDPALAGGFPLLAGVTSYDQIAADPELGARLEPFLVGDRRYPTPACTVQETAAPGPHGPVPARVYRPEGAEGPDGPDGGSRPGLVWAHGGAFWAGDLDMPESDLVARELTGRAGAVVVAVDYRLAVGGTCFPVPHDDLVAAWRWAAGSAAELGIDPRRLAIGGASAGGNLAAGAALRLRDERDPVQPCAMLLAYPAVHYPLPALHPAGEQAMAQVPAVFRITAEAMEAITRNYLGPDGDLSDIPAYAMPAGGDGAGLPPAVIVVCEYDDLRPSGEAYARQLSAAGVPVQLVVEPGVLHGHLNHDPSLAGTDHTLTTFADALRRRP